MIIYDPRRSGDVTRGTTCDALVESIDLADEPDDFIDLAKGDSHKTVIDRMYGMLEHRHLAVHV